ncbi:MAG: multicatalytic endopeptidase [Watsoniomyces obsoletus]|nr:MAG: multicatalytic endopeptidase [Watsoniomyces obsoletus]
MVGQRVLPQHSRPTGKPRLGFLDLPLEIRRLIYKQLLLVDRTIDLDIQNHRLLSRRLLLFRTCRQIYYESYPVFYGLNVFRVFPTQGKYFRNRRGLLSRLSPQCRAAITRLELRLGPGFNAPPRTWKVDPKLGLTDATSVHTLSVFVECDPSHKIFDGFRRGETFYTAFSAGLLRTVVAALPSLQRIDFDAWPSVRLHGELLSKLIAEAEKTRRVVRWSRALETPTSDDDVVGNVA